MTGDMIMNDIAGKRIPKLQMTGIRHINPGGC